MDGFPKTLRQWSGIAAGSAISRSKTALLLIDFQEEYFSGRLSLPDAFDSLSKASELLHWARGNGIAVVHVQHVAASPKSPLFNPDDVFISIRPEVAPIDGELVIRKGMPSSFSGTALHSALAGKGIDSLVLAGFATHMCVSSTAREALSLGYHSVVISDACATRDLPSMSGETIIGHRSLHGSTLAALNDRFSEVLMTRAVLAFGIVE